MKNLELEQKPQGQASMEEGISGIENIIEKIIDTLVKKMLNL